MQIDHRNDTSKSDRSDTSFNTSSASECHSENEYVQRSRSFTCSEVEYKSVQPKKKAQRLTRKMRNAKLSQKRLRDIKAMSSDRNSKNTDSSHVFNKTEHGKDTGVTEKDNPSPNDYTVNEDEQTVNPNEETVNGDEEHGIVSVKTEQNDEEDVKLNAEKLLLNGDSAISDQSCDLFLEHPIKKEDNEQDSGHDDSSISVKGKLSDEVMGRSFAELVNAAENGKQEDVDVNVSVYTDSAQMLQTDDKNTQYSGNICNCSK